MTTPPIAKVPDHDPAERTLLELRPAVRSVLAASVPSFVVLAVVLGAIRRSDEALEGWKLNLAVLCVFLALAAWAVEVLVWFSRRYHLTDRRMSMVRGVLTRQYRDIPLATVQSSAVERGVVQRALGLGSVSVSSASGDQVVWTNVRRPHDVLAKIREACDRAAGFTGAVPPKPFVLGLTGGIGAGKSAVAGILAELGGEVIDSDAHGRAALERQDVREALRSWWGGGIFDAEGRVDRRKVAAIVFEDPGQRDRLERLTHPLIKEARARQLARAQEAGKSLAVIDAPLLLEAGLGSECDAILFVDAPRDLRLARVWRSRGWDEAELNRREAAQWSVERKRAAASAVVVNDGDLPALRTQVQAALARLRGG